MLSRDQPIPFRSATGSGGKSLGTRLHAAVKSAQNEPALKRHEITNMPGRVLNLSFSKKNFLE